MAHQLKKKELKKHIDTMTVKLLSFIEPTSDIPIEDMAPLVANLAATLRQTKESYYQLGYDRNPSWDAPDKETMKLVAELNFELPPFLSSFFNMKTTHVFVDKEFTFNEK